MKTFKEFLTESTDRERSQKIRNFIKAEYGLTSRDVSVKLSGDAIKVKLKTPKSLLHKSAIENFGKTVEVIDRDERSGEILQGANTFVFVELDYDLEKLLEKNIQDEFESKVGDVTDFDRVSIFSNTFTVSQQGGSYFVFLNDTRKHVEVRDIRYLGTAILRLINISEDDSIYAKII